MAKEFRPDRLRLARMQRGLSKAALAASSDLSRRSITAYEKEGRSPQQESVKKLADALGFPVDFFYKPDPTIPEPENVSFRALSKMSANQRDSVLATIGLAVDFDQWIETRFERPTPDVPEFKEQDPEAAADAVRAAWKLGNRPIPNMIDLLEAHGVRVYSMSPATDAVDAVSRWHDSTPYIFLNTNSTAERGRFDAAHELGHLVMHGHGGPAGREAEKEADAFAGAFLMPRSDVFAHAPNRPTLRRIIKAKKRWGVSAKALTYRLHELDVIEYWRYRKLNIRISSEFGKEEPNSQQRESSQVLDKVFSALREQGVGRKDVARRQDIAVDDLDELVFSLVLTPIDGTGGSTSSDTDRPDLELIT